MLGAATSGPQGKPHYQRRAPTRSGLYGQFSALFTNAALHIPYSMALRIRMIEIHSQPVVTHANSQASRINAQRCLYLRGVGMLRDVDQCLAKNFIDGVLDSRRGCNCLDVP